MSASRKYQRYFKPISREPFSVAGTVRAQGRVGQTSHTRSNTGTLFKGNTPIGHGGENGSYVSSIVMSCNESSPSNGQSTMSTKGHIMSRIVHPTAVFNTGCSINKCGVVQTVKDFSPENASHSALIKKNNAKSMQVNGGETENVIIPPASCCSDETYFIGTRRFTKSTYTKRLASIPSSEYVRTRYLYSHPTEPCCPNNSLDEPMDQIQNGNYDFIENVQLITPATYL